jgi:hypothetical protein
MTWAAIGGAVIGGVIVGEYQKGQGEKQRESQKELTQEQADLQRELTEQQLIERRAELLGRERGQEEALSRATKIGEQAQQQFMAATEGRPEQIRRLQEIIRQQRLPEQQQAIKRGQLSLQQAGVRGPEATQQTQMLAGRLGRELGFDVEKLALEEELRRQRSREQMAGQRGLVSLAQQLQPIQRYGGQQ